MAAAYNLAQRAAAVAEIVQYEQDPAKIVAATKPLGAKIIESRVFCQSSTPNRRAICLQVPCLG